MKGPEGGSAEGVCVRARTCAYVCVHVGRRAGARMCAEVCSVVPEGGSSKKDNNSSSKSKPKAEGCRKAKEQGGDRTSKSGDHEIVSGDAAGISLCVGV